MIDIGFYNYCKHFGKCCYANFDEKLVNANFKKHNPKSSLIIGEFDWRMILSKKELNNLHYIL